MWWAARLLYHVPLPCLIESMSLLKTGRSSIPLMSDSCRQLIEIMAVKQSIVLVPSHITEASQISPPPSRPPRVDSLWRSHVWSQPYDSSVHQNTTQRISVQDWMVQLTQVDYSIHVTLTVSLPLCVLSWWRCDSSENALFKRLTLKTIHLPYLHLIPFYMYYRRTPFIYLFIVLSCPLSLFIPSHLVAQTQSSSFSALWVHVRTVSSTSSAWE